MKIIARPRRCGKTAELIKLADGRNGFIVVPHAGMAGYVKDLAREMGATINDPVTLDDVVNGSPKLLGLKLGTPLFFDNVEMMLEQLAGGRFKAEAAAIETADLPDGVMEKINENLANVLDK